MASVLRMKGFSKAQRGPESESGPHIKTPGVTDPHPECKQSSRSKEKRRGSLRVLLESEKAGNSVPGDE